MFHAPLAGGGGVRDFSRELPPSVLGRNLVQELGRFPGAGAAACLYTCISPYDLLGTLWGCAHSAGPSRCVPQGTRWLPAVFDILG